MAILYSKRNLVSHMKESPVWSLSEALKGLFEGICIGLKYGSGGMIFFVSGHPKYEKRHQRGGRICPADPSLIAGLNGLLCWHKLTIWVRSSECSETWNCFYIVATGPKLLINVIWADPTLDRLLIRNILNSSLFELNSLLKGWIWDCFCKREFLIYQCVASMRVGALNVVLRGQDIDVHILK